MNRFSTVIRASAACGVFMLPGLSHASLWQIEEVLTGTDGGYGYSSFHDSSGSNVMSGRKLGDISGLAGGTYNDQTGALLAMFTVDPSASGDANSFFMVMGNLLFSGGGDAFLDQDSTLSVDFPNLLTELDDTTIGFKGMDVCCSGNNNAVPGLDPNSFDPTTGIMTLWGSDGFSWSTALSGPRTLAYDNSPMIGMDLRFRMTQVPVPGSLALLGIGLMGLAGVRRK